MCIWVNPAFWIWFNLFINTMARKTGICTDNTFGKSGYSRQRFVSRSRCGLFLCRIIVEWTGTCCYKLIVISWVHIVCKSVIIISRIRYTCQNLACGSICHDKRTCTWFQTELSRCNLQCLDLSTHKVISCCCATCECIILRFIIIKYVLLVENHTKFTTSNGSGFDHVFVDQLVKTVIGF